MKTAEHQKAKELFDKGYRYKKIAAELGNNVSLRTLRRWKSQDGWGGGIDRRKYNFHPWGNQNARGHGAPIGNRNAVKHGMYDANNRKLMRYIRLSSIITDEMRKERKEEEQRIEEEYRQWESVIIEEFGSMKAYQEHQKQEKWELLSDVVRKLQTREINMEQYEAFFSDYSVVGSAEELRALHPDLVGNKHNRTE